MAHGGSILTLGGGRRKKKGRRDGSPERKTVFTGHGLDQLGPQNNQSRLRFLRTWYNAPPPPPINAPAAAPLPPPAAAPMPAPMAAGAAIVKTVFSLESPRRLTVPPDER